ncbi:MAG: hydroxyacid dehydrogenase, partial [Candidatus Paceibacterota bacterium]
MKTIFFELENWEKEYIKGDDFVFIDGILSEDKLPAETDAEIISVFVNSVINDKVLAHFPNLKLICTRSTGYDHIDIEACRAKGVAVATVPSYGE